MGKMALVSLNDLKEELLLEILKRLPDAESANRCKLVSRRWYSLISHPYFISLFLSQHQAPTESQGSSSTAVGESQRKRKPETLSRAGSTAIAVRYFDQQKKPGLFVVPYIEERANFFSGLSFSSYVRHASTLQDFNFTILASCGDLMFCCPNYPDPYAGRRDPCPALRPRRRRRYPPCHLDRCAFLICNPITKQWVELPSPPPVQHYIGPHAFGFVTEPYIVGHDSNRQGGGCSTVNPGFRFRAVILTVTKNDESKRIVVQVQIYCSETGEWSQSESESLLSGAGGYIGPFRSNIVAWRGKLHWFNAECKIVAYDPFQPESTCFMVIDDPKFWDHHHHRIDDATLCLGVCKGFLQVMRTSLVNNLLVWELKDDGSGEWSFHHRWYIPAILSESNYSYIQELAKDPNAYFLPLAPHPTDDNIVYLGFSGLVIKYNMLKQEPSVVPNIPSFFFPPRSSNVFSLLIPCWPTPIPAVNKL